MKKAYLSFLLLSICCFTAMSQNQMPVNGKFELLPLPYASDALAPSISKQTVEFHWGKHLQTYVNNTNGLIANKEYQGLSLEEVIKKSAKGTLYNNASQVWNHNFFFSLLSPSPQLTPKGELAKAINKTFGSFEQFKTEFTKAATSLFGSGWVWLIKKGDRLEIIQTPNGDCPITQGTPIIVLDVWEHGYYLDYQNRRADYIKNFWTVLDWKVAETFFK